MMAARRLLEQGVTLPPPPPDPAVVVAEAMRDRMADIPPGRSLASVIAPTLRDLFTTDALESAAAKVQEET